MSEFQAEAAAGQAASTESEVVEQTTSPGATDTPETVAETDEQKNARVIAEREERSRKRAATIQRRIDELTADKYAERQRAERLERALDEYRQNQQRAQQPQGNARPSREQFNDFDDYQAALAEWKASEVVERRMEAERKQWEAQYRQQAAQQQVQRIAQDHANRLQAYAKSNPDFAEVAESDTVVNDAAAVLLTTMENGPALIHALHRSPELVDRLNKAPAHLQGVILGEISASLKKSPQVSNAPAPGVPVGGKAAPAKTLADMDYDEFVKARRKGVNR